jgi:FtsP/CotA-like multicopper oxidase with cupredoxin domain
MFTFGFSSAVFLAAGASAVHVVTTNQPLVEMPTIYDDVELNLDVIEVSLPTGESYHTRGYNGAIPGPTIRTKAGRTLKIKVINNLGSHGENYEVEHNTFTLPNNTNLHTHGLHITATAPADDVFITIEPGQEYDYEYDLPTFHMAGNHWYHPHYHGSTSIQAGGGVHGLLVVDDLDYELPTEYKDAEEILIMLSHCAFTSLGEMEDEASGTLLNMVDANGDATTVDDTILVNGHIDPTISMTTNKWYRFRMTYASVEAETTMTFEDGAPCEMELIGKDGVFLHTAPRTLESIPFSLGGRVDVMIRCTTAGTYGVINTDGNRRRRRTLLQKGNRFYFLYY